MKANWLLSLALATVAAVFPTSPLTAQSVPDAVAQWSFESTGNPVSDPIGGHDAVLQGTANVACTDSAPVRGGSCALALGGGTDAAVVPHSPELSFDATSSMTIALWLKVTGPSAHILGKRLGCGGGPIDLGVNYQLAISTAWGLAFNSSGNGSTPIIPTYVHPMPNTWTHVAVTYDGLGKLTIFVNGTQVASATSYTLGAPNTEPLRIGGSGSCGGSMVGMVDEVRFFSRALSPIEIRLISGQNPTVYCTSGTTTNGCAPSMSAVGTPSSTAGSGFDLVCSNSEGGRHGLILYGMAPSAVSWAINSTSLVCVAPPQRRTGAYNSGGTLGTCTGSYSLDFNAFMVSDPNALGSPFMAGQVFYAQGWFRDPGAPKGTNLSNAICFALSE